MIGHILFIYEYKGGIVHLIQRIPLYYLLYVIVYYNVQ